MSGLAPPPCRDCFGKFGGCHNGCYCEICGLLRQVRGHLLSQRCHPQGRVSIQVILRETFHRILEVSDVCWDAQDHGVLPGGGASDRTGKGPEEAKKPEEVVTEKEKEAKPESHSRAPQAEEVKEEPRSPSLPPPGVTGKAAPVKPPSRSEGPDRQEVWSSEPREVKSKHRKRKRKSRSEGRGRSRSRHRRRREGRETSQSPRVEEPESGEREGGGPRPSSFRERQQDRRGPRSPSGPPPQRRPPGAYQVSNWHGPIPAGGARDREPRREASPKYTNKGVKKRLQQARAQQKGGWGRGRQGHRY